MNKHNQFSQQLKNIEDRLHITTLDLLRNNYTIIVDIDGILWYDLFETVGETKYNLLEDLYT